MIYIFFIFTFIVLFYQSLIVNSSSIIKFIIIIHVFLLLASFILSFFIYENKTDEFYPIVVTGASIVNVFIIYVILLLKIFFKFIPFHLKKTVNIYLFYKFNIFFIIILALFLLFTRMIMFNMSIGITGVAPPLLPFKISGILTYLASVFIPFLILYTLIFSKYLKSRLLVLFIQFIIIASSCLAASRSLVFIFGLIFLILQLRYKRYIFSLVLIYLTILGYHLATEMRSIIYQYDATGVYIDPSSFKFYDLLPALNEFSFFDNIISLVNRFSGLENIYNSVLYDVSNVENPFNFISRLIYINFNISEPFGDHNIEWFGHDIPGGLYDGPTQFNASILLFGHPTAFLIYGFVLSFQLFIVSKFIQCIRGNSLIMIFINLICSFILMFSAGSFYFYAAILILLIIIYNDNIKNLLIK